MGINPLSNRRNTENGEHQQLVNCHDIEGMHAICLDWNDIMRRKGLSRFYRVMIDRKDPPMGHITFGEDY